MPSFKFVFKASLSAKDDKITSLENAITESEIARLDSEEKILDYLRFEGHIHKNRTTNMKKLFNDFNMTDAAVLISDESELTAEIVDLRKTKKDQIEKLEEVKLCQICIEPYEDKHNKDRCRMGIRKGNAFVFIQYITVNVMHRNMVVSRFLI